MSIWATLGLDGPTRDLKTIKSAYAAQLKLTRPDDNPDGFMALRTALESARRYANNYESAQKNSSQNISTKEHTPKKLTTNKLSGKNDSQKNHGKETHFTVPNSPPSDNVGANNGRPAYDRGNGSSSSPEIIGDKPQKISRDQKISRNHLSDVDLPAHLALVERIKVVFKDPFKRTNPTQWDAVLSDDLLDSIDTWNDFEEALRTYLLAELGYYHRDTQTTHPTNQTQTTQLSPQVAELIFDRMRWQDFSLRSMYVQDQILWLANRLGGDTGIYKSNSREDQDYNAREHVVTGHPDNNNNPFYIIIVSAIIVGLFQLLQWVLRGNI